MRAEDLTAIAEGLDRLNGHLRAQAPAQAGLRRTAAIRAMGGGAPDSPQL
ncbi:MAG: hypothetical protein RQ966_12915 [Acetobacteraceae bacterium]|nr:hypothetical protein [Acetobacteraceae bacterium]